MKLTIYFNDNNGNQHFKSVVEAEHESTSPINYEAVVRAYYEGVIDQVRAIDGSMVCDVEVDDVEYNKSGVVVALCRLLDKLDEEYKMGDYYKSKTKHEEET